MHLLHHEVHDPNASRIVAIRSSSITAAAAAYARDAPLPPEAASEQRQQTEKELPMCAGCTCACGWISTRCRGRCAHGSPRRPTTASGSALSARPSCALRRRRCSTRTCGPLALPVDASHHHPPPLAKPLRLIVDGRPLGLTSCLAVHGTASCMLHAVGSFSETLIPRGSHNAPLPRGQVTVCARDGLVKPCVVAPRRSARTC